MQTSSRNGFGTKLMFHRPAGPGLFEATVWVLAFYIPIFPKSTWLVRPLGVKTARVAGGTSTIYSVEFLERRSAGLTRILTMYLLVAGAIVAMWAPLIGFFGMMSYNPGMNKTWVGYLIVVPLVWAVAMWVGLDSRREKLYEKAVEQPGTGAGA